MNRDENLILPGSGEFMIEYEKKVDTLRKKYPNCVVVRGLEAFQAYLAAYHYSAKDLMQVFPWSRSTFIRTTQTELPFIFVNKTARTAFKDIFETFPSNTKRATKLYSAEDLDLFFRNHLTSSVTTVVLPASMFVENISAFREAFQKEKKEWINKKLAGVKVIPIPNYWNCMRNYLPENVHTQALKWLDDLNFFMKEQNRSSIDRVSLPSYSVNLPEKIVPIFLSPKAIAERNACSSHSWGLQIIKKRGWVKHELTTPQGHVFGYTPGPLLGSPKHWEDYRIGATIIMLSARAEKLVGASAIKDAKHWNIPKDLIFKKWNVFHADAWQPMTDMEFLNSMNQ